eukprot:Seg206.2 transcript_id=Seg206.2/GoldUCD/mRNA.D3Y31 product="hypothetical protein" protein_id=Seg206.2/GoldUCD/D3Y31
MMMNADEEQRLDPVEEEEDDASTTLKPDDVPGPSIRKRKEVTRTEFDSLQVQASSVTAAINNFGEILKSFASGKKPRYDDELSAAQSAPDSGHAATFLGDPPNFAPAQSGSAFDNFGPSFALQSHPNEEASHFMPFPSPGHESLLSAEAMDTGFNPVYSDPDFSMVNLGLQSPTAPGAPVLEGPTPSAPEDDIPQLEYEGDEEKGSDVSASLATYVEGCVTKKIKKNDMEAHFKRFSRTWQLSFPQSPVDGQGSLESNVA